MCNPKNKEVEGANRLLTLVDVDSLLQEFFTAQRDMRAPGSNQKVRTEEKKSEPQHIGLIADIQGGGIKDKKDNTEGGEDKSPPHLRRRECDGLALNLPKETKRMRLTGLLGDFLDGEGVWEDIACMEREREANLAQESSRDDDVQSKVAGSDA